MRWSRYLANTYCPGRTIRQVLEKGIGDGLQNCAGDASIEVNGWIKSLRKQKKVSFVNVDDGSCSEGLQVVVPTEKLHSGLNTGAAVRIQGLLKKSVGSNQSVELDGRSFEILGESNATTFPLQKKGHSTGYLRELAHLRARTTLFSLIQRFRSRVVHSISAFFNEHEFTQVHPPILTSSDCEGAGETFTVTKDSDPEYFESAFLTVSAQLHLEALAMGLSRVWCLNPAFRAEASLTSKHLSEFWMCEAEVAFTRSLEDVMSLVEGLIKTVVQTLESDKRDNWISELNRSEQSLDHQDLELRWRNLLENPKWPRIKYVDAIEALLNSGHGFTTPVSYENGLQSEHERYLAEKIFKGPVFVTHYPESQKPFYMLPSSDESTVECFDLLFPKAGEICGGSLRQHDLQKLESQMRRHHVNSKGALDWYKDIRKWGTCPHGGFGIGLDRLLMYLTRMDNVREVVPFPRWVHHCDY